MRRGYGWRQCTSGVRSSSVDIGKDLCGLYDWITVLRNKLEKGFARVRCECECAHGIEQGEAVEEEDEEEENGGGKDCDDDGRRDVDSDGLSYGDVGDSRRRR